MSPAAVCTTGGNGESRRGTCGLCGLLVWEKYKILDTTHYHILKHKMQNLPVF